MGLDLDVVGVEELGEAGGGVAVAVEEAEGFAGLEVEGFGFDGGLLVGGELEPGFDAF